MSGTEKHQWSLPTRQGMEISQEEEVQMQSMPLLSVPEAEQYIEELNSFSIEEIGGSNWMRQSETLSKINIQAHQSAIQKSDEFVLEALMTFDKIPLLIEDLLKIEAWKQYALPQLMEAGLKEGGRTMRVYFILYHEATLTNLFEVILYHSHALECIPETHLIELVDYCSRKIQRLNSRQPFPSAFPETKDPKELAEALEKRTQQQEIDGYLGETDFKICVTTVSLMRYLCEHISHLPLAVNTRILDTHDILLSLIPLIENPPWTRRLDSGKWEKFVDLKWNNVEPVDLLTLTKTEAQVWFAVYHLMCNGDCRSRYNFNTFRKDQVLRIRKYLNDFMLDQLPVLADVQRYMDELSIMNVPEATQAGSVLLMEQVPEVRMSVISGVDWERLAKVQFEDIFSKNTDADDPDLRRMAQMFTEDNVENILDPSSYQHEHDLTDL